VGWYAPDGTIAGRDRTITAMWDDRAFPHGDVVSDAFVAAARLASPGATLHPSGNAPFRSDPWLFSLNGYVKDFREGVGDELRAAVNEHRRAAIAGDSDSEVVFALVLTGIDAGAPPPRALAETLARIAGLSEARLNVLLSDGHEILGTRFGNSLFVRDATVVSEPLDDDPGWREVPDGTLLSVTAESVDHDTRSVPL
jgi:glutamine amidotransferase